MTGKHNAKIGSEAVHTVFDIPDDAKGTARLQYPINLLKCLVMSEPSQGQFETATNKTFSSLRYQWNAYVKLPLSSSLMYAETQNMPFKWDQSETHLRSNHSIHALRFKRNRHRIPCHHRHTFHLLPV